MLLMEIAKIGSTEVGSEEQKTAVKTPDSQK